MTAKEFVLGFWIRLLQFWWPILPYFIVGLAVLARIEKEDKYEQANNHR